MQARVVEHTLKKLDRVKKNTVTSLLSHTWCFVTSHTHSDILPLAVILFECLISATQEPRDWSGKENKIETK